MLRQYGIATPSSLTPVTHAEDAQPNEVIKKRRGQKLPPRVASTVPPTRGFSNHGGRGSYPPRGYYEQGLPFTQYATRGRRPWRGHRNPPAVHWSRQTDGTSVTTHDRRPGSHAESQPNIKPNLTLSLPPTPSYGGSRLTERGGESTQEGSNFNRHWSRHNNASSSDLASSNKSNHEEFNAGRYSAPMHWSRQSTTSQIQHVHHEVPYLTGTGSGKDSAREGQNNGQTTAAIPLHQQLDGTSHPSSSKTHISIPEVASPISTNPRSEQQPISLLQEPTSSTVKISSTSTQVKPRPPVLPSRKWMFRSRSPSPKLPPSPLKRRKLESDHDFSNSDSLMMSRNSVPPVERPTVPLPGRLRKAHKRPIQVEPTFQPPIYDLEREKLSPVSPRKTTPKQVEAVPNETAQKATASSVKHPTTEATPITQERQCRSPAVKKEQQSPSAQLPIKPQRKLVRESVNFYPLPASCEKSNPEYRENRRTFFQQQNKALIRLGLRRTKAFYRDDGLVIEWTSPVPVWSDTLEPEIPNLASAMQKFLENSPQRTPKRNREKSSVNDLSDKKIKFTDASRPSPAKARASREKKPLKHWAAGIPLEDIDKVIHSISSSPSPPSKPPPAPKTRPPLPTRRHLDISYPDSNSKSKSSAAQAECSVSNNEQASAKEKDAHVTPLPPKRMIFKPNNPRRNPQVTPVPHTPTPGPQEHSGSEPSILNPSQVPHSDVLHQVGDDLGDRFIPEVQLPEVTSRSTSRSRAPELPTPVCTSPTAVDVSEWMKISQTPAVGPADGDGGIPISIPLKDAVVDRSIGTDIDDENVAEELLGKENSDNYSSDGGGSSNEEEDSETNLALEFFSRFITFFDSDRSKLEMAYAKDALFSCRVHHMRENDFSMAGQFAPEKKASFRSAHCNASASMVECGRSRICDRLRSLGPHKFRALPGSVVWDMAPLPFGDPGHLMFSVHGEVVNPNPAGPHLDHVLTVDQTFVLRPRIEEDVSEDDNEINGLGRLEIEGNWPLVAVSHQMTVRETRLLTAATLGNLLPWVDGIHL